MTMDLLIAGVAAAFILGTVCGLYIGESLGNLEVLKTVPNSEDYYDLKLQYEDLERKLEMYEAKMEGKEQ